MHEIFAFLLMVAPSPTDDHVMNHGTMLGIYTELEECEDAKMWIDEHRSIEVPTQGVATLPRHLWCQPLITHPET